MLVTAHREAKSGIAKPSRGIAFSILLSDRVTLARQIPALSSDDEMLWSRLCSVFMAPQNSQLKSDRETNIRGMMESLKDFVFKTQTPRIMKLYDNVFLVASPWNNLTGPKRLCITDSQRLGTVPKYTQEGDKIALIAGLGHR